MLAERPKMETTNPVFKNFKVLQSGFFAKLKSYNNMFLNVLISVKNSTGRHGKVEIISVEKFKFSQILLGDKNATCRSSKHISTLTQKWI